MPDLVITNGDSAADLLTAAGIPAVIVPWRDILHEGPLRPDLGLEQLSDLRAGYLAERFGLDLADVRAEFVARDAIIRQHRRYEQVAIWVEHDLYDQLQLMQVLAFFGAEERAKGLLVIQADDFLGNQTAETILRFNAGAQYVDRQMLGDAQRIWTELGAGTPQPIARRLDSIPEAFPFLGAALRRFLAELPAPGSGLSRTEALIVEHVAGYQVTPAQLFRMAISSEEAAFMGDWSFFRILEDLAFAREPLVAGLPGRFPAMGAGAERDAYLNAALDLTPFGVNVFSGRADNLAANAIDRWWGGTRLLGHSCWRWDRASSSLIPPAGAARQEQST